MFIYVCRFKELNHNTISDAGALGERVADHSNRYDISCMRIAMI